MAIFWGFFVASYIMVGWAVIKDNRRNRRTSSIKYFLVLVAWWGVYQYFLDFYDIGGALRLVGFSFLFLALSPVFGFLVFWEQGKILKTALKGFFFLTLWAVAGLAYTGFVPSATVLISVAFGFVVAILVMLPFFAKWKQHRLRAKRQRQRKEWEDKQQERQEEAEWEAEEKEREKREFLDLVVRELKD